ncbi:MAG: hypothetical protein AAFV53_39785, partial [Myxococcota bacterium]
MHPQASIRRLLKSTTVADIHAALGQVDAQTAASLLDGIAVDDAGALVLSRFLTSGDTARPYRTYAAVHLLHRAGDALADVRATLRRLSLRFASQEPAALDLSPLSAFPALAVLSLTNAAGVTSLPELPALTALDLRDATGLNIAEALTRPLRSLTLARVPLDDAAMAALGAQMGLQQLTLRGCAGVADLAMIAALRGLKVLRLEDCPDLNDASAMPTLTGLSELRLSGLSDAVKAVNVEGLHGLVTLSAPGLRVEGMLNAPDLSTLRCHQVQQENSLTKSLQLRTVSIHLWRSGDLRVFQKNSALETLSLHEAHGLIDLSALSGLSALSTVHIGDAKALVELSPLAELEGLE